MKIKKCKWCKEKPITRQKYCSKECYNQARNSSQYLKYKETILKKSKEAYWNKEKKLEKLNQVIWLLKNEKLCHNCSYFIRDILKGI